MSRSIKEVIETLSQMFLQHGFSKITADMFRRAKFNETVAARSILNIIYEIISVELPNNFECDRLFLLVYVLNKLKYPRLSYLLNVVECELPSRELLLSLGFLLVKFNVFACLRSRAENYLYESIVENEKCKKSPSNKNSEPCKVEDELNGLIVLHKKIDLVFRRLYSSINMYENVVKKCRASEELILKEMNENSSHLKFRHLCLIDVLIQGNLKLQKRLTDTVRKQNTLLKLHLKWIQMEPIFWKWMSSVANKAFSSSDNTSPATAIGARHKFYSTLPLLNDTQFDKIFRLLHGCESDDDLISDCQKMKKIWSLIWSRTSNSSLHVLKETNNHMQVEIDQLQTKMHLLEEESNLWLSQYLAESHSGSVEVPLPRR